MVLLVLEEGPVYKRSDVKLVCRPEPLLLIPDGLEVSPLNENIPRSSDEELRVDFHLSTLCGTLADSVEIHESPLQVMFVCVGIHLGPELSLTHITCAMKWDSTKREHGSVPQLRVIP